MPQEDYHGGKWPEYVVIGEVLRPHGVKGALRVRPLTDHPQRFQILRRVYFSRKGQGRKLFSIDHTRAVHGAILVQVNEIQSRQDAEQWRGALLEIPGNEVPPLPEGKHYLFELMGLRVQTQEGVYVGKVCDILCYAWHDIYVVRQGKREYLIPAVADIIVKVDIPAGVMTIKAIDGLLE